MRGGAVGRDLLDRLVRASCDGANTPLRLLPLLEERRHVGGEILDDRQVGERPDLEPAAFATLATCVRQVQRGRPLTVMAQEPHMPTRQAKR